MANGVHFQGKRVSLGPFEDDFWHVGLVWYNDPEIIAMTSDDPNPLTEEQFRDMIQVDLDHANSVVMGVRNERDQ
ncbi:MAG: hypothetical protein ACO36I_22785, partial [Candidatus Latescibacterota bacterium]